MSQLKLNNEQVEALINNVKKLAKEFESKDPNYLTNPKLFAEFLNRYEDTACEIIPERIRKQPQMFIMTARNEKK